MLSLQNPATIARVLKRIERAESGNLGDIKRLTTNLYEMRLMIGPGLRIYFSLQQNDTVLLLLIGGDKSTQTKDIARAEEYLEEYKNAGRN